MHGTRKVYEGTKVPGAPDEEVLLIVKSGSSALQAAELSVDYLLTPLPKSKWPAVLVGAGAVASSIHIPPTSQAGEETLSAKNTQAHTHTPPLGRSYL